MFMLKITEKLKNSFRDQRRRARRRTPMPPELNLKHKAYYNNVYIEIYRKIHMR
jgi:hypothetical protein